MAFSQWSVANYFLTLESCKHVLSLYSKFKSLSLLLLRITFFKMKQERRELLKITRAYTDIKKNQTLLQLLLVLSGIFRSAPLA